MSTVVHAVGVASPFSSLGHDTSPEALQSPVAIVADWPPLPLATTAPVPSAQCRDAVTPGMSVPSYTHASNAGRKEKTPGRFFPLAIQTLSTIMAGPPRTPVLSVPMLKRGLGSPCENAAIPVAPPTHAHTYTEPATDRLCGIAIQRVIVRATSSTCQDSHIGRSATTGAANEAAAPAIPFR